MIPMSRNGADTDTDDERRVVRDGERLLVGLHLMDHKPIQHGATNMSASAYHTVLDGVTMLKDDAIRTLKGQLADARIEIEKLRGEADTLKALRTGAGAAAFGVNDAAARQEAARAMGSYDRQRKADASTGYGAHVQHLNNAWKTGGRVA